MAPISCWLLLASLLLLHPSGIVFLTVQLQQARFLLGVAGLPLTIPSNRNHLCLLHEALSWAGHWSCLVSMMPIWLFHPPGIITISFMVSLTGPWSHWVLLASSWQFHPPGIFSFPPWCVQQGQDQIGHCWFPFEFSISQESSFAFPWTLLFSPSRRQLLFPFIAGSGAGDSPFFPFTSTWTEALTLHFPATPSRQVVFSYPAFFTGLFSCCPNGFQPYL